MREAVRIDPVAALSGVQLERWKLQPPAILILLEPNCSTEFSVMTSAAPPLYGSLATLGQMRTW